MIGIGIIQNNDGKKLSSRNLNRLSREIDSKENDGVLDLNQVKDVKQNLNQVTKLKNLNQVTDLKQNLNQVRYLKNNLNQFINLKQNCNPVAELKQNLNQVRNLTQNLKRVIDLKQKDRKIDRVKSSSMDFIEKDVLTMNTGRK